MKGPVRNREVGPLIRIRHRFKRNKRQYGRVPRRRSYDGTDRFNFRLPPTEIGDIAGRHNQQNGASERSCYFVRPRRKEYSIGFPDNFEISRASEKQIGNATKGNRGVWTSGRR